MIAGYHTSPPARPQPWYRELFRSRLLERKPDSVLDVGCGQGELLRILKEKGICCAGIEAEADLVDALCSEKFDVHHAVNEVLPFANKSFDYVVSEFSAHHFGLLSRHIEEALRVARKGVMILDQYYDQSIPALAASYKLDCLCKKYDRENGMIHHNAYTARDFVDALPLEFRRHVTIQTLLKLVPLPNTKIDQMINDAVGKAASKKAAEDEFTALLRQHTKNGFADDAAIFVSVEIEQDH